MSHDDFPIGDASVRLAQLLSGLPGGQERALRLRHLEHWPLDRIAQSLGKSPREVAALLLAGAHALYGEASKIASADGQQHTPAGAPAAETAGGAQATDTLAGYLSEVDAGSALAVQHVLKLHPDAADELREYFDVAAQLDHAYERLLTLPGARSNAAVAETQVPRDTVGESRIETIENREFGEYELLKMIGAGGMGVVYKARQSRLNRIVAVKMIRSGQFAANEDTRRFQYEAESAASLRHPNIVAIHEVGRCQGQFFYSMDFIEGRSLAELVRESPLPPRRAAMLVNVIAKAIHFAHGKGVLHRDIKPPNILLDATQDDRPLIADFGLAKRLDEQSAMTASGAVLGTPSYAPPEQLRGDVTKIGVASDVYSLGALLYEVVTGRPPFRASTPLETIGQVIAVEPVSPRLLNPHVPRDLETICLKCLQKEPSARYATAQDLADELDRFAAGQPIRARPIGRVARAWRWCRRNPAIAGSCGIAATGVLVALIATIIAYANTSRSLDKVAAAQRLDAASFRLASDAVDELFTEVSENALLNQPGLQPLRKELLQRTLKYYRRFLDERGADTRLQDELALAHFRVGQITEMIGPTDEALASLEQARAMQTELMDGAPKTRWAALADTHNAIGIVLHKTGRLDESLAAHRDALALRDRLAVQSPDDAERQRKLANSYMNLGIVSKAQDRFADAREQMEQAQAIRRAELEHGSEDDKLTRDLGKGSFNLANLALAMHDGALAVGDEEQAAQELADAVAALQQAIEIFEGLYEKSPADFANRIQLATCYNLLADITSYKDDEESRIESLRLYDAALPILEALARTNPDVVEYQANLAALYLSQGMLQSIDGRHDIALAMYEHARLILEGLTARVPDAPAHARDLANALRAIAAEQVQLKQWQQARQSLTAAIARFQSLSDRFPESTEYPELLGQARQDEDRLNALEAEGNR